METFEFNDISDLQDSYIENLNFGISDSTVLWFAKEIIKQRILLWCRITTTSWLLEGWILWLASRQKAR